MFLLEQWLAGLPAFASGADARRYLDGVRMTLELSLWSLSLSLLIGVLGAWMKASRLKPLRLAVGGYIELFRNTPLLAQVYFFYFGLGSLLPMASQADGSTERMVGNFSWAVIVLGLHAGAFKVEALRSGVDAVPAATLEAAAALGLSPLQVYRKVVLPLALRNALPAIGNSMVQGVKATSVAYAIAVPEMMSAANRLWTENFNVLQMMPVVLATYLLLVLAVTLLFKGLERGLRLPGYHYR
ncbi:amino acid ABC transporter permease [Pseudomonas sp. LRF_L74]|uniref:amino acid ABC transporter permease n=1 Tax=Pseudomonas sp. LRF_L74 TaxID=3369422 RepID=UPI003F627920